MNKKAPLGNSVEQYNAIIDTQLKVIEELRAEVAQLMTNPTGRLLRASREEVKRLEADNDHLRDATKKVAKLQAENARICKAGDAVADLIKPPAHGPGEHDSEWLDWQNATKSK